MQGVLEGALRKALDVPRNEGDRLTWPIFELLLAGSGGDMAIFCVRHLDPSMCCA